MRDDELIKPGEPPGAPPRRRTGAGPRPDRFDGDESPIPRFLSICGITVGTVSVLVFLYFFHEQLTDVMVESARFFMFIIVDSFLYYAWIFFLLYHYRIIRQNELLFVMAGAADARQPLPAVVWAYLQDRPHSTWRHFADGILLCAVYPGYWFWYKWRGFDAKVHRLVDLLELGMPLSSALRGVPGVAARETILAASVGEATGKLGETLKQVPKWRLAAIWIDLLPRYIYPVYVLLITQAVVTFIMIFIMPKFERIFKDFKVKLPQFTLMFMDTSKWFVRYFPILFFVLLGFVLFYIFNPTLRWYLPVLGRFSRMHAQSRVLKTLGLLLQTGQTIPQALNVLLGSGYFRGLVRGRLVKVCQRVEQGDDLSAELYRQGLLPTSMVPLVQSAQKINNLPWALDELGEHQAKRTATAAHRFCMAFFPICIMLLSVMIGFVAVSMFMPLLTLLENVAPTI